MNLAQNLNEVLEKIQKAKPSDENIQLIAVSKSVDHSVVRQLHALNQIDFGENRVQVLKEKIDNLSDLALRWHFIGRLQTNKINQLIGFKPVLWHSCDSLQRAIEYNKRLEGKDIIQDTLLQINSADEEQKQGVEPDEAIEIYEQIKSECKNLNLKGVMSIGALSEDVKKIQKSFEITHKIYENLKDATICSMGMSSDYELAVKCGSNMLRIGSILYR